MALFQVVDRCFSMKNGQDQQKVHHLLYDRLSDAIRLIWHNALDEHGYALVLRCKWLTNRIDEIQSNLLIRSVCVWII